MSSDEYRNTFGHDKNENLDVYGEHTVDNIGHGNTSEELVRRIDELRSKDEWSYQEYEDYKYMVGQAGAEGYLTNLTESDIEELYNYTPPNGITIVEGRHAVEFGKDEYGIVLDRFNKSEVDEWFYKNETQWDNLSDEQKMAYEIKFGEGARPGVKSVKANDRAYSYDEQTGDFAKDKTASEMSHDNMVVSRKEQFKNSFSLNGNYLGEKGKIVLDLDEDRPNEQQTRYEQESGDFHINVHELEESFIIASELESDFTKYIDKCNPIEIEFKCFRENVIDIDKMNDYGGGTQRTLTEIDLSAVKNGIQEIYDKNKKISEKIEFINDQLANFINCVRFCNTAADEYYYNYFKDYSTQQVDKILDDKEQNKVHVYAFDNVIKRYLENDLTQFYLSPEEKKRVVNVLIAADKWKYEHADSWEKFMENGHTVVWSFGNGVADRGNQLLLGVENLATIVEYRLGNKDTVKGLRERAKDTSIDDWYLDSMLNQRKAGNANLYSAMGPYHEFGKALGSYMTDVAIQSVCDWAGVGVVGKILISAADQGIKTQEYANNEKLSDEAFVQASTMDTLSNIASITLDQVPSYLPKGSYERLLGKTITSGEKNFITEHLGLASDYIVAKDTGEFEGTYFEYVQENKGELSIILGSAEKAWGTLISETMNLKEAKDTPIAKGYKISSTVKNEINDNIEYLNLIPGVDLKKVKTPDGYLVDLLHLIVPIG